MQEERHRPVELRIDLDPRIHFALQQNDVPVVKAVHIENHTQETLRDLEVRIEVEPAFAPVWSGRVASVGAGAVYNLAAVDLQLSPAFLAELTERVRGTLRGEVRFSGHVLASSAAPVELLARDEWGGLSSLPEILAAFVLPNHPAVERVLRTASDHLLRWTGDPSLSGYQSRDRRRAYMLAGAIYAALQNLDLSYVNAPASFEDEGQRVRLPDRILESRMATCLDVALFAAACLEQAGLNPLLVIVEGHAFTGLWLEEGCFSEPVVYDGVSLRKRVRLNELAVFDPTAATARPAVSFDAAGSRATGYLAADDTFRCAIDVQRARKGRIRPLPERAAALEDAAEDEASAAPAQEPPPPDVSGIGVGPPDPQEKSAAPDTPATRLDRWRRKLLDLTLRNRLLNFRDTKKTLRLLCPDIGRLEDMLAEGTELRVLPRPDDLGDGDPRDPDAHRRRTGQEALDGLLLEELQSRRLYASATREELDRRMIEIYRAARLGLEEGGASALYLAVGFLAWYETGRTEQRRLAPILLLPLELHRKSVREGFTLQLGDEEPRVNVTLLEMLKIDHGITIPGLDPLPEDKAGLDVPGILNRVRRAIRDQPRWDVVDEVRIGLFSFAKFLMWRDLSERADDLMKNPVVEHLVNRPDQAFDPDGRFPETDRLDDERAPNETFCPLPADSSELAAVFAAAEGRSFVLEGPPGTGKSQTITNLIAHCLTEGKTVLFVSEKMAALDVVRRRLRDVGLERSCLELHSNKARKREVLGQLEKALDAMPAEDEREWEREARKLASLRNELNAYVRALHAGRPTGETVFQATSRLIGLREATRVDLRWPEPDALDADGLAALRDLVGRLTTTGEGCGGVKGHAWEGVRKADWTPGWQEDVQRAVHILVQATEQLGRSARSCSERLGLSESGWSLEELELLRELTRSLVESPAPPTALLVRPDWDEIQSRVGTWIERGRSRDRLRRLVRKKFADEVLELDLDDLCHRHERAGASWWPASWWRRRLVRKQLKRVTHDGKAPPAAEIGVALARAIELRNEQRRLDEASEDARQLLGRYWNDGEARWDGIARVCDWARVLRGLAVRAAGDDFERGAALRERWAQLATEGRELLRRDASVGRELLAYGEALDGFRRARAAAVELLDLDVESVWGADAGPDALGRVRSTVAAWQGAFPHLRDWCAWRRARAEAVRSNLGPLVEAYEQGRIRAVQLRPTFERSYTQWWLSAVTDREPVLSRFFSPEHERKIEQFRAVDERYTELTRRLVQARLARKAPTQGHAAPDGSEMGILRREIAKKRRQIPVRRLLQKIPSLLPRLKPCLLMSPMSVAQYLDAGHAPFDVVVFDEASQIPVWDAVGAIARGRQAIIVGDPKQLPPTSFFERGESDDEEQSEEVVDDLESILDDCIGARIPWLPLNWHYRSRHETLITFSNYSYYRNRLLTFPSAAREGLGVSWRHVPHGVYDRGRSRTNRAEAEAVVAEILRRLRDPQLAGQSIGVVTLSQPQQVLIEDLLDAERSRDPDLDSYFAEEREEPVFVKNLENVQGDERDVILFSICYGPDESGRTSMHFGPMNRDGGERRLNVAVTRAKREVVVFSTLTPDQIDLSRTRARGVRDLKTFLEYAQRGPSALAEATQLDPDADFDSPFEEAVLDALVQRGWEVHKQVGCARYRIDLGVLNPDAPGRYLLGVECDGANYHRGKTARDRDKLRAGVLSDLGWKLHRIWSTDWWNDPAREMRKLEAALEKACAECAGRLEAAPGSPG